VKLGVLGVQLVFALFQNFYVANKDKLKMRDKVNLWNIAYMTIAWLWILGGRILYFGWRAFWILGAAVFAMATTIGMCKKKTVIIVFFKTQFCRYHIQTDRRKL